LKQLRQGDDIRIGIGQRLPAAIGNENTRKHKFVTRPIRVSNHKKILSAPSRLAEMLLGQMDVVAIRRSEGITRLIKNERALSDPASRITIMTQEDPHLHWDGTRWLRWNGAEWLPVEEAPAAVPQAPVVQQLGRGERKVESARDELRRLRSESDAARAELAQLSASVSAMSAQREESEKIILDANAAYQSMIASNAENDRLLADMRKWREAINDQNTEYQAIKQRVTEISELAELQEVGIYEYRHPLADAAQYQKQLDSLKARIKAFVSGGTATTSVQGWMVNGSQAEGTRMVKQTSKLMLRAYNAEVDNCLRTLRPHNLDSAIKRLEQSRTTIAKLGKSMEIQIAQAYHRLRLEELSLTSDYLQRKAEEKELQREERERQREEAKAQKEFEAEKKRLQKERSHYMAALEKLEASGDPEAAKVRAQLEQLEEAIRGVEEREANIRTGYVYVISNVGAFGEDMVKIGLTRRLEPMDRVNELGDASVPFRFDVHALIFSEDAVSLENELHRRFEAHRVNRVNLRREFFNVTPGAVKGALQELVTGSTVLEFHDVPEAIEWRQSVSTSAHTNP